MNIPAIICFGLLLASCGPHATHENRNTVKSASLSKFLANKNYVAIPLSRSLDGLFMVWVTVGKDSALLVLDSGASETCLDEASAKKFGVDLEDVKGIAAGYGGSSSRIKKGRVSLALGSVILPSREVTTLDFSHVNKSYNAAGEHIDGVLGADILLGHHAVIDYSTSTLFLKR